MYVWRHWCQRSFGGFMNWFTITTSIRCLAVNKDTERSLWVRSTSGPVLFTVTFLRAMEAPTTRSSALEIWSDVSWFTVWKWNVPIESLSGKYFIRKLPFVFLLFDLNLGTFEQLSWLSLDTCECCHLLGQMWNYKYTTQHILLPYKTCWNRFNSALDSKLQEITPI